MRAKAIRHILPTQAVVREWLHYEPESGYFTWIKEPRKIGPKLGKIAGCITGMGYRYIRIPSHGLIGAQRLAWVYMYGSIADDAEIDHIDLNRVNNAISNLRLANRTQQQHNKRVRADSMSGLKGAFYDSRNKSYYSRIKLFGQNVSLGSFGTAEEAHAAYCEAALKHFGEFARTA